MAHPDIPVKPHVFCAMQRMDTDILSVCTETELRPVLPGLTRMALCASLDASDSGKLLRKKVLGTLSKTEAVNNIVEVLSIDFHALEQDVKKEQQLRSKLGSSLSESVLVSQLQHGIALEFERSKNDPAQRIRLLLSELLFIASELKDQKAGNYVKQSDLFECQVYLEEILDVLCIAIAELPNLLSILDIVEALMCVGNGNRLVCQLVANNPESFLEVCNSLVARGEKQEEESLGGRRRLSLLHMLCAMNPKGALTVRNFCVENCNMPGLLVALSTQLSDTAADQYSGDSTDASSVVKGSENDTIPFFTSLLLGSDVGVRTWISAFIKAGQKRKPEASPSMLCLLRKYLLEQLIAMTPIRGQIMAESKVVVASSILRLYCALKGIATMKYSDEEMGCLLRLVITHPASTRAGAHFISLGICTLIASPGLLRSLDDEQHVVNWFRWLMTSETHFEKHLDKTNSPGEMLFLLALNFHNNQMQAITDLVCNTLGMKIAVKTSALVKIRQIFTMELFTEQVIAAHAVRLPVTPNLDANATGYLPVHSILQLLKSRAFSKHRVSIKKWVYKQICSSCFPLHPLLPQLIESYVNSVIPKTQRPEHTNERIQEDEALALFETTLASPATPAITGRKKNSGNKKSNKAGSRPKLQTSSDVQGKQLCPQLLMLYYLLLYEDLYKTHKKMIDVVQLPVYSEHVMSKIPISYLVQEALKHGNNCQNLFPPMIRLLSLHFPHLCLVEDWLDAHVGLICSPEGQGDKQVKPNVKVTPAMVKEAMAKCKTQPSATILLLEKLLSVTSTAVLRDCQDELVAGLPYLLEDGTPRRLQDLVKKVWFKLHTYTPRRCPPLLEIVLRVLSAYTQACRVYLNSHIQDAGSLEKEKDQQELKMALLSAQESAIVQILLEVCLPLDTEKMQPHSELSSLREVCCLVFSYIHQVFIADPHLAKLVHFQGYPSDLIPQVVAGVPSMHICLDFIPELLGQPQRKKQIFGIQLLAALCTHYHLPKSMNIAKLGIDVMFTLMSVLEKSNWVAFFQQTIPSLVLICEAFPPLCEDATALLTQIGRVCHAQLTVAGNASTTNIELSQQNETEKSILPNSDHKVLYSLVQATFTQITRRALVLSKLY
ncbi:integrator complex subunit 2 [Elysia marginata]|uniref:Integrator complex subunit 2 n=1 Tax=Elysia marginata TaxID=1093978 RepID=A0AAV4EMH5_9GAST|nr:integrator complex subunit 2 [Elysia marginata]